MKIKASELLDSLIYNTQIAFIEEDNRLKSNIVNYMDENNIEPHQHVTVKQLAQFFQIKDENYRMVIIRTILSTLYDYDILDKDIDLNNDKVVEKYLTKNVSRAIINKHDNAN